MTTTQPTLVHATTSGEPCQCAGTILWSKAAHGSAAPKTSITKTKTLTIRFGTRPTADGEVLTMTVTAMARVRQWYAERERRRVITGVVLEKDIHRL